MDGLSTYREKITTNKAIWNWIFYKPINLLYFSCCVDNFSQIKLLDFEESVSDSKLELRRMILQLVSSMFFSQYTEISYNSTKSLINTCLAYKLTPPIQSRNMHQGAVQTNRYGTTTIIYWEFCFHNNKAFLILLPIYCCHPDKHNMSTQGPLMLEIFDSHQIEPYLFPFISA